MLSLAILLFAVHKIRPESLVLQLRGTKWVELSLEVKKPGYVAKTVESQASAPRYLSVRDNEAAPGVGRPEPPRLTALPPPAPRRRRRRNPPASR
jgi:hypothetical protein